MLVGTGDILWIMDFYPINGFRISHRIKNFFTDNCGHPMYDGGVQLADMVYLRLYYLIAHFHSFCDRIHIGHFAHQQFFR